MLNKNLKDAVLKDIDREQEPSTCLGKFLFQALKKKNYDLSRLSELTKIPLWHLQALQDGNFDKLPPNVYMKGVFMRLTKFLDIGLGEIEEKYNEDRSALSEQPETAEKQKDTESIVSGAFHFRDRFKESYIGRNFLILTPRKIGIIFSILFLAVIFSYIWYQYDVLVGPPILSIITPARDSETENSRVDVRGKTLNDVYLTVNGQNVYVDQDGAFALSVELAAGLNAIEIVARNKMGKESKVVRQVFYKTGE